jgi:hypothetical protein
MIADQSKQGMRKVAAQEIGSIDGLRKLYSNVISSALSIDVTVLMTLHSLIAVARLFCVSCIVRTPTGRFTSYYINST